ncbi:GTP-binding protein HflX [Elusimicrobium simillimum]|uniref:GTPase HflX n=1 Tax=Elusimicrobium simillimum TaxID=3143438 RepID=UPI003C6F82A8
MEKVYLVAAYLKGEPYSNESVYELERLAHTAGAEVEEIFYAPLAAYNPATFIGKGKAYEIAEAVRENDISAVIFNEEITPAQQKNLESIIPAKIIDRTWLILDIFAKRARTKEGELQVELAQLQFLLPRLSGKGAGLMQQSGGRRGGIGTRGPGERKLEYDRRRLRIRIAKLEREIEQVKQERKVRRMRRAILPLPQVAIVGYTNAGKSTLLNTLTKETAVYADDKLFATLDPTTRRVSMPGGGSVLFTDTVGFIQKLPHNLVSAFRATLEELADADVILHVKDASSKDIDAQNATVHKIVRDLEAQKIPMVEVFNKIDAVSQYTLKALKARNHGAVFISALENKGVKELLNAVEAALNAKWPQRKIKLKAEDLNLLGFIYDHSLVKTRRESKDGITTLTVMITDGNYHSLQQKLKKHNK